MAAPSADLTTEWEGGSLAELVAALEAAALPVRIEVIAPGTTDSNAGEIHLLAGGLADAFAGSLRRDDAMAALQRLEGARFTVEARLPDPASGSLSTPGPREGSLKERPVASLMRYCEEYVLTCRIEVWRGQDRAVISYRRGEIISTMVGGSDGSERLPEVMGWSDGSYEIVLPAPVLPPTPGRKPATRSIEPSSKTERKRHSTLPMAPTDGATDASATAGAAGSAPRIPAGPAAQARPAGPPQVPAATPAAASPPAPTTGRPSGTAQASATAAAPPNAPASQQPGGAGQITTQRLGARQVTPQAGTTASASTGTANRPSASPPSPPARPTAAPGTPAQPGPASGKPTGRALTPAMGASSAQPPAQPLPSEATARGTPPVPAVPLVPARPAPQPTPPVPVPPAPPPFQLGQAPRPGKQPAASNDLRPASGTIEAKSGHAKHLPPSAPPVEIADQPQPVPESPAPAEQVAAPSRPATSGRLRAQRKRGREQPVKVYVLIGLAIGLGVVLAYWAYWYLPFFHH